MAGDGRALTSQNARSSEQASTSQNVISNAGSNDLKTPNGRTKWYLRFTITGAFPRLFGPFPTKRKAILFLDNLHNTICEFWTQVDDVRDRYANEGEFEKVNWGPIIEHPLATKGR